MPTSQTRSRFWIGGGLLLFLAALTAIGWSLKWGSAGGSDRSLNLVISGDTLGWIIPCGCAANQSGGLLRRASYVEQIRKTGKVLLADAGGAPGGTSEYQRAKFEAILKGEILMGYAAHNLGGPEATLGTAYLRDLSATLHVPFVSSNLRDSQGTLVAESSRILNVEGRRIALTGVLSRRYATGELQIDDPLESLLAVLTTIRGRYDSFIVLAYLPEDELRELTTSLPEADAVIGGPTGQAITPQAMGVTLMASAANKGKFLIHLEADASQARLAWSGRAVEMGPEYIDDPKQQSNLHSYLADLAHADFQAGQTGLALRLPGRLPADHRVAGNDQCVKCHQQDCRLWQSSKHSGAWTTLTDRGYHVEPFCQQCHTTGYGLPGGFESLRRTPLAVAVQCESCHGPALAHARQPAQRTPLAARDQCTRCHDPENSPSFTYGGYWEKIRHGSSASSGAPSVQ